MLPEIEGLGKRRHANFEHVMMSLDVKSYKFARLQMPKSCE